MNFGRIKAIARKEVFHIRRDPFTLALALLLPVMLVTIFGSAIEFNVKFIRLAVYDGDRTQSSRLLIEAFSSSNYFLVDPIFSPGSAIQKLDSEKNRATLIIDPQFEYDLLSGRSARAQVILDGADNSTIGSIVGYINRIQTIATEKILEAPLLSPVHLETRFLYNPELNSQWFVVPGLAVVVIAILSILLTSLTIAKEWENGSMELLLSTPVEPVEIIIGKLLPYIILGLGAVAFVYIIARLVFHVPFVGSHLVFFLGCLLFLSTYLAQGILISVITRRQQISMQFAMLSGLLPSLLLSGFIFSIENMPFFFQIFTSILPAKWFMIISRDVFLKGSNLQELKIPFLALAIINTFMILMASKKFKKNLEP
jgi:ABC-2 type transport system permease protein